MDKGTALTGLVTERAAEAVLFCGDDLGDLPAFAAVRALRADGIPGCAVVSASAESPQVAEAADLVAILTDETRRNPLTAMPPFGRNRILTEQEINAIVDFLQTL